MKRFLLFLLLAQNLTANATIYQIGTGRVYQSPNALYAANIVQEGDTIEIDAGTYTGQAALGVWQADNLLIRGVGGRPHLVADGEYIWGKGIWVFTGNNIRVENIEFSGASVPDQNGAGIRLDGVGLTVRHCYFHDNENGILTGNPSDGDILIEFSEFGNNGYGDGFSHNLYVGHVNKLIFRFNYSHHAKIGHVLKSRANENYILYNRLMDEETGNSSRLIDLSNGGFSIIMGNLLMQGQNAENNNLVGYGKEGLSNTSPHELYFINNTSVNKRAASCIFLDIQNGTSVAYVANNIFAGSGNIINGATTTMTNNLIETNIGNLHFADEENYDYRLKSNSPAIDFGTTIDDVIGYSLTPEFVYIHPQSSMQRSTVNGTIDAGAYEYGDLVATENILFPEISVYPNPTRGLVYIDHGKNRIENIIIYDQTGRAVPKKINADIFDLSPLPFGLYFLKIEIKNQPPVVRCISKI